MVALADGVSFSAASSGLGSFSFSGAQPSFLTLAQAVTAGALANGQIVSYVAQDSVTAPTQREWGHGTFSAAGSGSIARTTVLGSTSAGAKVNFSVAPIVSLTLLAEDVWNVTSTTGLEISTPGNIGWNSGGSAASAPFVLINGPNGAPSTPVPTLYPVNNNSAIALDFCPKGSPTDLGYGVAWIDVTNTDQITSGSLASQGVHLATHAASNFLGSVQYVAGTILPFNFGTFNGDTAVETNSFTINADATVTFKKLTTLSSFTFSTLPGSPPTGALVNITDATVNTWGTNITAGSGANNVLARYNGAHWTVVGI